MLVEQVNCGPVSGEQFSDENFGWLSGQDCKEDERVVEGLAPECEPTCNNQRPACLKVFYMDTRLCFCKSPLVRDAQSRKCVKVADCPAA